MEIFDVTQTDPALLVTDNMGIQYSMEDQASLSEKVETSISILPEHLPPGPAERLCGSPPALLRSLRPARIEVPPQLSPGRAGRATAPQVPPRILAPDREWLLSLQQEHQLTAPDNGHLSGRRRQ